MPAPSITASDTRTGRSTTRPAGTCRPSARSATRSTRASRRWSQISSAARPTVPEIAIEPLREEHWDDVARIYAEGIATGSATFETEVPSWERWDESHLAGHRLVAVVDG